MLEIMDKWIDDCPPIHQPVRFGITTYRNWFAKLEEVGYNKLNYNHIYIYIIIFILAIVNSVNVLIIYNQ